MKFILWVIYANLGLKHTINLTSFVLLADMTTMLVILCIIWNIQSMLTTKN